MLDSNWGSEREYVLEWCIVDTEFRLVSIISLLQIDTRLSCEQPIMVHIVIMQNPRNSAPRSSNRRENVLQAVRLNSERRWHGTFRNRALRSPVTPHLGFCQAAWIPLHLRRNQRSVLWAHGFALCFRSSYQKARDVLGHSKSSRNSLLSICSSTNYSISSGPTTQKCARTHHLGISWVRSLRLETRKHYYFISTIRRSQS